MIEILGMNFGTSILVAITGILLVFLVLCLLVAVVVGIVKIESLLSDLAKKKKTAALPEKEKAAALPKGESVAALHGSSPLLISSAEGDDKKIAAVIAAAVAVMTENFPEVKSGKSRFVVRDIRRIS
jgi:Na+-transporting methylmalonyl-CoA/oxaloacetate decarboxylase gamma subunit